VQSIAPADTPILVPPAIRPARSRCRRPFCQRDAGLSAGAPDAGLSAGASDARLSAGSVAGVDEALVALLIQEVVEEAGHACVGPAASVGEACVLIDSCHVDAALLDIWLKDDEFVYPAARKLASRGVPFAFVSARAVDGIDAAFADRPLIPKPMDERRVKGWLQEVGSGR
jgi:hypothetical protein